MPGVEEQSANHYPTNLSFANLPELLKISLLKKPIVGANFIDQVRDSENESLIEERSSDGEFSSSESESDDDCLDSATDWCQIDVTSPLPSHPKFPFIEIQE
ncbi:hypothetical protein TNCV_742101 [Trichonephila clavipes]|nr:hypothetical protein TNCV_742101 [Trichonephila clavipes]